MEASRVVAETESLSTREAFPNLVHRAVYYALVAGNAVHSIRRSGQEAKALGALNFIPGVQYTDEDKATIARVEQCRREEIFNTGLERIHSFMLDQGFGSSSYRESILTALDD